MKKKLSIALAITAIAPFGLVACGDDDEESSDDSAATTEETTEDTTASSTGGGSSVPITAAEDGSLAYDENSAEAEAGRSRSNSTTRRRQAMTCRSMVPMATWAELT